MKQLVIAPAEGIGDAILTVPLIRAITLAFPQVRIDLVLPPYAVNLFERCPYIRQILTIPRWMEGMVFEIKNRQYDVGIILRRQAKFTAIFRLGGVKCLMGFDKQYFPYPLQYQSWGKHLLDVTLSFPSPDGYQPHAETLLQFLNHLGADNPLADPTLEVWWDPLDEKIVKQIITRHHLDLGQPMVVFNGLSRQAKLKQLPLSIYSSALALLRERGYCLVAMGAGDDYAWYDHLSKRLNIDLVNLCGLLTLRQSVVFLQHCELVFGLDSAIIHMAAAVQVPNIIGIYGPYSQHQWGPYPYNGRFTPINSYHREFSASQVLQAVDHHIGRLPVTSR